ncbi:MAG: TetR/AcrR family transcriptional regulator [Deltaproteobacteria bacterium]|nr:TetR/AcrR family transcriptional regulator [Deltaproteobacteria bacterium]
MPRPTNPTLRNDILVVALRLIEEKGAAAVTLRDVASAVHYSVTAIYRHFANKEDLLLALKLQAGELLAEELQKAGSEGTLLEQLHTMGRAYVRFGLENPAYYRLIFQDTEAGVTPSEEQMQRLRRGWVLMRDTLKAWLEESQLQGVDVDQEAHVLWAMVHGVTSLALAGRFPFTEREKIFAVFDVAAAHWGRGVFSAALNRNS